LALVAAIVTIDCVSPDIGRYDSLVEAEATGIACAAAGRTALAGTALVVDCCLQRVFQSNVDQRERANE
jgi:hypothetical protein